ncbi:twin-arginine translocase TatA/TatE family subunit [Pedobacter sp.]|jgi:sec-independent protein translocase protein TatA|uniref:Sec-independent protein translocase subunit TatA/TatB n=1 Tax=Pedobacter sp. TaxID=1411316 RepID=UPI002C108E69|nr:twin-arginine translocase TatA/TatE family subunit [Pedobacter sp.]HWW39740.1 twin-arginine translocase TatA/TatE family subunit [Pedobacter sp.]
MYQGTLIEFLNIGGSELILIFAVILLLFGGKKLPELARGLGQGIRDFKDASEGVKREIHRNINNLDVREDLKAETVRVPTQTAEPINLTKEVVSEGLTGINLSKND